MGLFLILYLTLLRYIILLSPGVPAMGCDYLCFGVGISTYGAQMRRFYY